MLQAHRMIAEFYISTTLMNDRNFGWGDVRDFAAAGMGIGAHDIHHVQLTERGAGIPPASVARMTTEVAGARQIITERAGIVPDSMAYVGGGFDATLIGVVTAAGYTTARSIQRGVDQAPDLRFRMRVSRIGMYDDVVSLSRFAIVPGLPTFSDRVTGKDPG
jgi:Polysaccharide deacetylase